MGAGNLNDSVKLPTGEDLFDWLAVNVTDFYNEISLLYGLLTGLCTASCCPTMTAGPFFEYKWADGNKIKKPIKCSAPKYMNLMLAWVQAMLDDESIFPMRVGEPFPSNIRQIVCTIFKRLFRCVPRAAELPYACMHAFFATPASHLAKG